MKKTSAVSIYQFNYIHYPPQELVQYQGRMYRFPWNFIMEITVKSRVHKVHYANARTRAHTFTCALTYMHFLGCLRLLFACGLWRKLCLGWEIHLHISHSKVDDMRRNRTGNLRLTGQTLPFWLTMAKAPERGSCKWTFGVAQVISIPSLVVDLWMRSA